MTGKIPTEVLPTDTPELFQQAVRRATELLRAGDVVALPTETVYGLAANALDPGAVKRIYVIKDRPAANPIIVHVAGAEMARRCAAVWPDRAGKLARAFWPGPLTLVLPRSREIPDIVTAGGPTVGLRWPSHPFIQAVIRECGFPLAAPSANPSSRVSPTSAEHVRKHLAGKIRLVVDGGPSQIGIESTVLDLTVSPAKILRPGMIHEESLAAVVGAAQVAGYEAAGENGQPLHSPGRLPKHYSPKARLVVLRWQNDHELRRQIGRWTSDPQHCHVIAHSRIPAETGLGRVSVIPHDAAAFARAFYAELHRCDEAGAELIVVETLPETGEWRALADRLSRAASG